jgi:hypothetical protein
MHSRATVQQAVCPPGWKLAIAQLNAELENARQQCSALQQRNTELQDELIDRLPEVYANDKIRKQVLAPHALDSASPSRVLEICLSCLTEVIVCFLGGRAVDPPVVQGFYSLFKSDFRSTCRMLT